MNDLDDFGFGDISPNTLEAEHQQEQEQEQNTSTQQNTTATPPKKKRQRYTIQEKLCYLHKVRRQQENGQSQRKACHGLNIVHKQII